MLNIKLLKKKWKKIKLKYIRTENMLTHLLIKPITGKNMEWFNNFIFSH